MTAASDAGSRPGAVLLRSLSSAVVLDGHGDLQLLRETRGAEVEWGGVYAQHIRLTGAWRISIQAAETEFDLPSTLEQSGREGDLYRSRHASNGLTVEQEIAPLATPPGAVRSLRFSTSAGRPVPVCVTSTFTPFLLPVMVEGIRPVDYLIETRAEELRVRQRGFALAASADPLPSRLYLDRASWRGGRRKGPVQEIASDHELLVPPGEPAEIRLRIAGGLERDLDRAQPAVGSTLPQPRTVAEGLARDEAAWAARRPRLALPGAPELERAYGHACAALRRLYSQPSEDLTGLVAGYPWYSSIWCRDLAWMLPAVLWLGDHAWVTASLDTVFRHQATRAIELLGAEAGELPMQISPGPVLLFGTSDTTLYYPALATRLVLHTGDPGRVGPWRDAIERSLAWAERRADPETGLFRNGGEVARLERTAEQLSRVRYGIDAPDTTIWDSADRRDHAIDLQILWRDAIERSLAWAERRADPETGLFRNGGEVARLERTAEQLSRVRYGIDAPDTTIWDSADRRDHAIDLQILWRDALRAGLELTANDPGAGESRRRRADLLERLEASVPSRYRWHEEEYLYDSIRGRAPVTKLRPNALRAVTAGLVVGEEARRIVQRAAAPDLSTAWGVRTLSTADAGYRPEAYHDGQVWTIATAWAADAAFAAGEVDLGLGYLRTIASRFEAEPEGANECYRGDRPEPYDSCFLLGFSVAPFLTVVFERLWGLTMDATVPRLEVRPAFPDTWESATLEGLTVGTGSASLRYRKGGMEVAWHGRTPLQLIGPNGGTSVAPGEVGRLALPTSGRGFKSDGPSAPADGGRGRG